MSPPNKRLHRTAASGQARVQSHVQRAAAAGGSAGEAVDPIIFDPVRMSDDPKGLRRLKFMPSRIPALDAVEVFVPDGAAPDAELEELQSRTGQSRWHPVQGGHRVLILYERGAYNAERFSLVKGAWDHQHCSRCRARIESMTLCWVTESGEYVLLDEKCHTELFGAEPARSIENDFVSVRGPVERFGDDLVIRIPLEQGGEELAPSAGRTGEIKEGCLCVIIKPRLAERLRIREGSLVIVDNRSGKFTITRSEENDRLVH